jgi:hypothetical protein
VSTGSSDPLPIAIASSANALRALRSQPTLRYEPPIFEIISGVDLVSEYESSPGKFRAFCRRCGSPLCSRRDAEPEIRRIRLGTLDSDPQRQPLAHVWVCSKAPWYPIADSLPQYLEGFVAEEKS